MLHRRCSRRARSPRATSPVEEQVGPGAHAGHPRALQGPDHRRADPRVGRAQRARRRASSSATYVALFERFAAMIAEGTFPYSGPVADSTAAPRVGDGVLIVDGEARVRYLSPNANSAHAPRRHPGQRGRDAARRARLLRRRGAPAFEDQAPVVEEFEQSADVVLLCRCMPILAGGEVVGGVLLVRDVTDLRQRDRLLLSKDATIREIHHRVKNNLQTISSLLRLQAPAADEPGGDGRGRRVGAAHPHDRARPRVAVARARRRRHVHRDRAAAAAPRRGEPAVAGPAGRVHARRRRRAHPGHASPRRCRSCSPS